MLVTGDRIGDWVVDRVLGRGGMGAVFACHNALTDRITAAVKVLWPDRLDDMQERFVREVEALDRLHHPAIVRIKGWGSDQPRGLFWLAMELVQGEELGRRMARGPIPDDQAVTLFRQIAEALSYAHEHGIVHRDIKPANLLLLPDGTVRVVDFGIAASSSRTRLTPTGQMPGTPSYLAPEVFTGNPDPVAIDIYALGQVLYEAVTGRPAFVEDPELTMTQRLAQLVAHKLKAGPLDPGPTHAVPVREAILRATAPRHQRLPSVAALVAVLDGRPIEPMAATNTMYIDLAASLPKATPTTLLDAARVASESSAEPSTFAAVSKTAAGVPKASRIPWLVAGLSATGMVASLAALTLFVGANGVTDPAVAKPPESAANPLAATLPTSGPAPLATAPAEVVHPSPPVAAEPARPEQTAEVTPPAPPSPRVAGLEGKRARLFHQPQDRKRAERAAAYLRDSGVEVITVVKPSDPNWERFYGHIYYYDDALEKPIEQLRTLLYDTEVGWHEIEAHTSTVDFDVAIWIPIEPR